MHRKNPDPIGLYWEALIPEFSQGNTTATPLDSPESMSLWVGKNKDFDYYVESIKAGNWRCMNTHEARVYLIQTPKNQSIVWMSWVGYRGSRWHIVQHFAIGRTKPTVTAQKFAEQLAHHYQEKWNEFIAAQ